MEINRPQVNTSCLPQNLQKKKKNLFKHGEVLPSIAEEGLKNITISWANKTTGHATYREATSTNSTKGRMLGHQPEK